MKKILLPLVLLLAGYAARAQYHEADSLKKLISGPVQDTFRLRVMLNLVYLLPRPELEAHIGKLSVLAEEASRKYKAQSPEWKSCMGYLALSYKLQSNVLEERSQLDSSFLFYRKSIAAYRQVGDQGGVSLCEAQMAANYTTLGNYPEATYLLYKALAYFDRQNVAEGKGVVYRELARLYNIQRDDDKSLYFMKKALAEYERSGNAMDIGAILFGTSVIYANRKDYKSAALQLEKALDVLGPDYEYISPGSYYLFNGLLHYYRHEPAPAVSYILKYLQFCDSTGENYALPKGYYLLGKAYAEQKQYSKADIALNRSLESSRELQDLESESNAAHALYEFYKQKGDAPAALRMYELDMKLSDSLKLREAEKHILGQQFRYEYEKKALLAEAAKEKELSALSLAAERSSTRKNILLTILAAGLVLIGAGTWFLYTSFRQKSVIQAQKNNLLRQKLLVSQMNPHFIFNSLNAIQNDIIKQNTLQAGIYLSRFAAMMRMLLDFSRRDYISLEAELEFLRCYLELQQLRTSRAFEYEIHTDPVLDPEAVAVPPVLAQPFLENAIEHGGFGSQRKGLIKISIRREAQHLAFEIEDNGIGLEASQELRPGSGKTHASLATTIARERLEALYPGRQDHYRITIVDRKYDRPASQGVRVTFVIPYKEN